MIQFFLPFVIGLAMGIEPPEPVSMAEAPTAEPSAEPAPPIVEPVAREPEPQMATGKFTTAIEIKPILGMTKQNWVAVRLYEGNDLLYFTHLLAWRCGMWEIRYSVNGESDLTTYEMEPCHEDTAQPNALTDVANYLPYVVLPPESIESVYVEVVYDDGTTDFGVFQRQSVLLP